jgi:MarR family transcriptional regulator, 2-MHQ and catechol-resistance regulon repressor
MSKPRRALANTPAESDRAETLKLVIAVGRALQAMERQVRPHLVESGLALTEFAVLEALYHKGPLRLGEVRDRILVTGASTTYVVKKLEERGLMRRRDCPGDSRVVLGELTAKGRALIEEVFPVHVNLLQQATAALTVAQKREVTRLLRTLSQPARRATGEHSTDDD